MAEDRERRQCTRAFFATRAQVLFDSGQTIIEGELQDISIIGMFIKTAARVSVGSPCSIQLMIPSRHSRLLLEDIQGVIVRVADDGLGIQFTSNMEWFVIFKIYTHFSGNSQSDQERADSALNEGRLPPHGERRSGLADRRKKYHPA